MGDHITRRAVFVLLEWPRVRFAFHPVLSDLERLEEGAELEVVPLGNGVVFVIVAMRAVKREAKKRFAGVFHDVAHPLIRVERVPVSGQIAGGHARLVIIGRHFVRGEHFDDHAVIALVCVQRADDPVAPTPNLRRAIPHIGHVTTAIPVRVAPDIHPVPPPTLAILR